MGCPNIRRIRNDRIMLVVRTRDYEINEIDEESRSRTRTSNSKKHSVPPRRRTLLKLVYAGGREVKDINDNQGQDPR